MCFARAMPGLACRRWGDPAFALRGDRVGTEVLGVSKVVSEDSVRRALNRGTLEEWDGWLNRLSFPLGKREVKVPVRRIVVSHEERLACGTPASCPYFP